jgi:hypothetical protein
MRYQKMNEILKNVRSQITIYIINNHYIFRELPRSSCPTPRVEQNLLRNYFLDSKLLLNQLIIKRSMIHSLNLFFTSYLCNRSQGDDHEVEDGDGDENNVTIRESGGDSCI